MKRLMILILSLALLLSACGGTEAPEPAQPQTTAPEVTEPEITEPETTEPETTEPAAPVITATFTYHTDGGQEFARVTGCDDAGNQVWVYETVHLDMAQLCRVSDIGSWEDRYYLVEDNAVVALSLATGEVLWRNEEFGGAPAGPDAVLIDEGGTVYLCGFFGPDFFSVSCDGMTINKTDVLSPDYYWGHKLVKDGLTVSVYFSGGPEGDMGPEAYVVEVLLP